MVDDLIARAESWLALPISATPQEMVGELVDALKETQRESWSHQETLMHVQDVLSMVKGESRRQLEEIEQLKAQIDDMRYEHDD